MSGLAKLEGRIATLRWVADWLDKHASVVPGEAVRGLADTLESAAWMVRPDYDQPAEEEPAEPEPAEPQRETEGRQAGDEPADAPAEPSRDVEDIPSAPRPVTVPAAVIRAWAQKQGIPVGARGPVPPGAMTAINDRRRTEGLAPFIQKAGT